MMNFSELKEKAMQMVALSKLQTPDDAKITKKDYKLLEFNLKLSSEILENMIHIAEEVWGIVQQFKADNERLENELKNQTQEHNEIIKQLGESFEEMALICKIVSQDSKELRRSEK